jgi:fumarate hydratase class I
MWHLQLRDFPAIVTMDAHGHSLHQDLEQESGSRLEALAAPVFGAVAEGA